MSRNRQRPEAALVVGMPLWMRIVFPAMPLMFVVAFVWSRMAGSPLEGLPLAVLGGTFGVLPLVLVPFVFVRVEVDAGEVVVRSLGRPRRFSSRAVRVEETRGSLRLVRDGARASIPKFLPRVDQLLTRLEAGGAELEPPFQLPVSFRAGLVVWAILAPLMVFGMAVGAYLARDADPVMRLAGVATTLFFLYGLAFEVRFSYRLDPERLVIGSLLRRRTIALRDVTHVRLAGASVRYGTTPRRTPNTLHLVLRLEDGGDLVLSQDHVGIGVARLYRTLRPVVMGSAG